MSDSVLKNNRMLGLSLFLSAGFAVAAASADTEESVHSDYECLIQPRSIVDVASPVSGIVSEVFVQEGQSVSQGDVVATLKSDVEAANMELARARASYDVGVKLSTERADLARKKVERAQELIDKDVIAKSSAEEIETEARIAELNIEQALHEKKLAELELVRFEAILEQKSIRSPVDGVVVERLLWPGESANEQSNVMTIAELDPLEVRVFAPTNLYGMVSVGMSAVIRPDPPLEGTYEARVSTIDKVFDAASDTFGLRLLLPNPESKLPAGIPCRIKFGASNE